MMMAAAQDDAELGLPELEALLRAAGLIPPGATVYFTALTGGVASDIWKVEAGGVPFVVKRALPKLRVAAEWRAPVSRNQSEAAWLKVAKTIVPDAVPDIVCHDAQAGLFAMTFFPPENYPVWKAQLRDGHVDLAFAAQVGRAIAQIHSGTANDANIAAASLTTRSSTRSGSSPICGRPRGGIPTAPNGCARWRDDARHQARAGPWRLQPEEHPGRAATARCSSTPNAPGTATRRSTSRSASTTCCSNACGGRSGARATSAAFDALAAATSPAWRGSRARSSKARVGALLPGLLLARVDGKSPVEYLTEDADRERVRACRDAAHRHPACHGSREVRRRAWRQAIGSTE